MTKFTKTFCNFAPFLPLPPIIELSSVRKHWKRLAQDSIQGVITSSWRSATLHCLTRSGPKQSLRTFYTKKALDPSWTVETALWNLPDLPFMDILDTHPRHCSIFSICNVCSLYDPPRCVQVFWKATRIGTSDSVTVTKHISMAYLGCWVPATRQASSPTYFSKSSPLLLGLAVLLGPV